MERARAAVTIAAGAIDPSEIDVLKNKLSANPEDSEARFELSNAQMAAGDRDEAADGLLHIIAHNADWNEGAAKKRLLEIFDMIGLSDPWVAATRRKLSAILFG